jgi:hypothetical protein
MKVLFCEVTPYILVDVYQRLGEFSDFGHHGRQSTPLVEIWYLLCHIT